MSGFADIESGTSGSPTAENLVQINGTTVSAGTGAQGAGAQRVTVATDTATIAGSAPGTAGTPSTNVITMQGIASGTPIPVSPPIITWTQSSVSLSAATSATLIASNANRKALRWMVVGTNPMTVVPGAGPAVANAGMNYSGNAGTGLQGGSEEFSGGNVSTQQFTAISTLGTTVIVWEGV